MGEHEGRKREEGNRVYVCEGAKEGVKQARKIIYKGEGVKTGDAEELNRRTQQIGAISGAPRSPAVRARLGGPVNHVYGQTGSL